MRDLKHRSVIIDRPLAHEALLLSTEEDEVDEVDELDTTNFEASGAVQRNYRNIKQSITSLGHTHVTPHGVAMSKYKLPSQSSKQGITLPKLKQDLSSIVNRVKIQNSVHKKSDRIKGFHYEKRIGEKPLSEFFENYKQIERSIQRKEHKMEAQTAFLKNCS